MRRLNAKQKKMLVQYYNETGSTSRNNVISGLLENENDYETIWQDADRFLIGYHSELMYGRQDAEGMKLWVRSYK